MPSFVPMVGCDRFVIQDVLVGEHSISSAWGGYVVVECVGRDMPYVKASGMVSPS